MKYRSIIYLFFVALLGSFIFPLGTQAAEESLAERFSGQILLQVESYGRAWYVNPVDGTRYYLKDGAMAYDIMRDMGLGITNADLADLPKSPSEIGDQKLVKRLAGRIVLQVEELGQAWYINPLDGLRYYLEDGEAAYDIMRQFGQGIATDNLAKIPMNDKQLVHDTTFDSVAYALLRGSQIVAGKNVDQILPPASMSKLMSALVLLDQNFDWNQRIIITQSQLDYPKQLVGDDATSEINLQVGDSVTAYDLWVAMLVASSNQATMALVDNSGLSRIEFIKAMNVKVEALGLRKTVFFEPTGLDAHSVTTAREMAIIAREAFNRVKVVAAMQQSGYTIAVAQDPERSIKVVDRNYSLQDFEAEAAKTGFLVEAQRCVSLKKGAAIVVVLHARSMSERNGAISLLLNNY